MTRVKKLVNYQTLISTHTLTWSVTQAFHSELFALQFQLTRSRGAWRFQRGIRQRYRKFQLTRSRGAWPQTGIIGTIFDNFNSHAHVERDTAGNEKTVHEFTFQLTRSRGAWHIVVMLSFWLIWFQLTRSRGAWQTQTWYPTKIKNFNSHAHVERDLNSNCGDKWRYHFNSHAHVERDYFSDVSDMLHKISTHTLTWSVTVCSEI